MRKSCNDDAQKQDNRLFIIRAMEGSDVAAVTDGAENELSDAVNIVSSTTKCRAILLTQSKKVYLDGILKPSIA